MIKMIKTNFKENEVVLERLINGEFILNDYEFVNIEEKKTVLAKYLNVGPKNISYNEVRNLFIDNISDEEYNVLTEKESHIQGLINMVYDINQDCLFMAPETVSNIFNIDYEYVVNVIGLDSHVPDSISILNLAEHIVNKNGLSKQDFICKIASELDREDFLSCDYEEIKLDGYYIYRFNN